MDRNQEFTDILSSLSVKADIESDNLIDENETKTTLKNRHEKSKLLRSPHVPEREEVKERKQDSFIMPFLTECNLLNSTLLQLSNQIEKIKDRPEQISFSQKTNDSSIGRIEDGLDICSTNISLLTDRLEKELKRIESEREELFKSNRNKTSLFSFLTNQQTRHPTKTEEADEISVKKKVEVVKEREKRKKSLMSGKMKMNKIVGTRDFILNSQSQSSSSAAVTVNSTDQHQQQLLQSENSKMLEEMAKDLFSTLESTETQVLQIARLQTTLHSHLTAQYDLTRRLFDDSEIANSETKKGNEYLRRSAEDSSVLRKILVSLLLMASILLILLHYFNK